VPEESALPEAGVYNSFELRLTAVSSHRVSGVRDPKVQKPSKFRFVFGPLVLVKEIHVAIPAATIEIQRRPTR
jgi:hypothetical protein